MKVISGGMGSGGPDEGAEKGWVFLICLLAALLLHVVLLPLLAYLMPKDEPPDERGNIVQLVPLPRKSLDLEKEKKRKKPEERPKGQVVDLPAPEREEKPDKAKYLSEFDTKVKRETKARVTAKASPHAAQKMRLPAPQKGPVQPQRDEEKRLVLKQRELSVDRAADYMKAQRPKVPHISSLLPTMETLDRISGAPANDHLKGVAEGENTMLNSQAFKYASFFNRVKRGVAEHWHPDKEYVKRDPEGRIYGIRDRVTVVDVTLTKTGQIMRINLNRKSGVPFLDDVAIAAFWAAQPFPNPPEGLMNENEEVRFTFGFFFELSSKPKIHFFKYR